ncbi:hypothetical protein BGX38DRAFT_1269246 [Terfezia claveryi]|nr:hypothetical protein BGX38DRAFT_1269246 [Terfezia claveryi]
MSSPKLDPEHTMIANPTTTTPTPLHTNVGEYTQTFLTWTTSVPTPTQNNTQLEGPTSGKHPSYNPTPVRESIPFWAYIVALAGCFVLGGLGYLLWKCVRASLAAIRARLAAIRARRTPAPANRVRTYHLRDFAAGRTVELPRDMGNDERYTPAQVYATWLAAQP